MKLCKNCKWDDWGGCSMHTCSPLDPITNTKEDLNKKIANKDGNCVTYRRCWYKFWVKEAKVYEAMKKLGRDLKTLREIKDSLKTDIFFAKCGRDQVWEVTYSKEKDTFHCMLVKQVGSFDTFEVINNGNYPYYTAVDKP